MAEERNLWLQLKRNTKGVVWTRIEATSGLGIPDLHGFYGRCFWVELKIIKDNKIKFSAHQIAWINRHVMLGAPVFVLARDPRAKTIKLFSGSIVRSPTYRGSRASIALHSPAGLGRWTGNSCSHCWHPGLRVTHRAPLFSISEPYPNLHY